MLLPSVVCAESVDEALAASQAAYRKGQREQATALLESRIERAEPGDDLVPLHGTLGNLYLEMARSERALAHFDWLIASYPDDALAHYKRGLALERLSRAREAIEAYTNAGKLGADEAEIRSRIGFNYMLLASTPMTPDAERERYQGLARGALKRAIELDPRNHSALGNLADILFNQGQIEEALAYYLRMDELEPSRPTTLARIGSIYLRMGRCAPALDHLLRAATMVEELEPGNQGDAWVNRDVEVFSRVRAAECLIRLERPDEARSEIARVLEIANCEGCTSRSLEIDRSKSKAEELLQQLDAPTPANAQTTR
jgi:tetratricopeptide (TPR) repeat protein